jgi:O-antigen/teichoic acid export membrane protein
MKVVRTISASLVGSGLGLNRAFTGLALAAVLGGLTRLVSLATVAYLARTVGTEAFGQIGFAEATVMYVMLISDLGLQTIGVREIARIRDQPGAVRSLVSRIVGIQFTFALLLFAALNLFAWLIYSGDQTTRLLLTLYGFALLFPYVFAIEWWLNGTERLAFTALGRLAREGLFLILAVLFVGSAADLLRVPLLQGAVGLVVSAVICVAFVRSVGGLFQFDASWQVWRELLARSWPFAVTGVVGHLWLRLGVIFLGLTGDEAETGIYTAAWKLFIVGIEFHSLLGLAFVPIFSRTFEADKRGFLRTVRVYRGVTFVLGFGCVAVALPLSGALMSFVYGEAYLGGTWALTLLLLTLACWFFGSSFGVPLIATKFERAIMTQTLVGATVGLVLSLLFIPLYGGNGAALAYFGSILVSTTLNIWSYFRLVVPSVRM